jgi:MFS family permease
MGVSRYYASLCCLLYLDHGRYFPIMPGRQEPDPELKLEADAGQTHGRHRWFPGWTMLGVSAAAQYMSAPGQSYSVAAIKDPMLTGLNVSEVDYSLAYACATVVSACLLPFVGQLVDRFGARVMLSLIAAGLTAACWMMSCVETLPELYFGFAFVRSLGQGALSLVSVWIVGEWFERKRGIATAMAGLGGGLSVMTIPLINNWLIQNYAWQTAWQGLACCVWGMLMIPGILILRDRPEDMGLHPDGLSPEEGSLDEDSPDESDDAGTSAGETSDSETPDSEAAAGNSTEPTSVVQPEDQSRVFTGPVITSFEDSWTVREVLRNATFWKLLCVPATSGLVGTGLIFHQVELLKRHGLDRTEALLMMTVQAGFATFLQFPTGWLTDRVPSRYILAAAMLVLGTATMLMINMPVTWLACVYALLLGIHGSVMRSTATVVWINYFGRAHQGAVRGVAWSVMIMASAIGPLPLAYSIDHYGAYEPALIMFLALPMFAAAAVWTAYPPKHPE